MAQEYRENIEAKECCKFVYEIHGEGHLGMMLIRHEDGFITVGPIEQKSQANVVGLIDGDRIREIAGWIIPETGLPSTAWQVGTSLIK